MTTMTMTVIATDEGTHGGPDTFRVMRREDGTMTLVCRSGSAITHEETVQWDGLGTLLAGLTKGRVRWLHEVT